MTQKSLGYFVNNVIAAVDEKIIHQSIQLGWRDFEAAVRMAAAMQANLDYIVSRNMKDFVTQPAPVHFLAALLALLAHRK